MSDCEKMKEILDEIQLLIDNRVTSSTPAFKAWHVKTERFLTRKFGSDSIEVRSFCETRFFPALITSNADNIGYCKQSLIATGYIFQEYLQEMENEQGQNSVDIKENYSHDKVFIVHGHDGELKESVARIIEKQGIEAIILSEKANKGRTIIEKFEDYSDVGGAICLFTTDDIGREKAETVEKPRARQNVVFEAGFFMGKRGRNHVVLLADSGVEMPSDLAGVVYSNTANWQVDVLRELKAMGYTVDFNKLF